MGNWWSNRSADRVMALRDASLKRSTIGVAVILTNDYVGCPDCTELPGTRKDRDTWETALKSLLFDVRSHSNLSRKDTIRLLEEVSALDMPAASDDVKQHLVFVYSGHGGKGCIVCQDGQSLSTEKVCEPFLQHRCGTGVAKLLFFDACRGEKLDRGRVRPRAPSVTERGGELMPCEGNCLVVFSTLPGSVAQESTSSSGSPQYGMWSELFAPKLADCNKSLTALLADVNKEMVDQCRGMLPHDVDASFQVAETIKSSLIGDVNLFASAAELRQETSNHNHQVGLVPDEMTDSAQTKDPTVKNDDVLSKEVSDHDDYRKLFRKYVSRKAAGKVDVLLAELGLDQETVRACKTGNPLNDEEAVQDGLIRWKEGQGKKQPPTWAVLVEAMDFAGIDQSNIRDLKRELGVLKGT